jgi:hypothetical protein
MHPSKTPGTDARKTTGVSSPESAAAYHQRGFGHYKKGEHVQAVAAFTEAIRIDPEAPNSYIARALCYRRLDNMPAALQDERTAEELGGPEKTAWDRFVNRSRKRWSWDFDNPEWRHSDPLSRKAVLLSQLNRQILNGGLFQWIANGYGRWIHDVIEAANEVGTDASREVAAVLEEVSQRLEAGAEEFGRQLDETLEQADEDSQELEIVERLYECEDRYFRVQSQFVQDVENWLEKTAASQGRSS